VVLGEAEMTGILDGYPVGTRKVWDRLLDTRVVLCE